ncbi:MULTISPECIES: ABC transporter permease [Ensifer]|uniref:ABC transporter permease n=1 Tax=Ensifer TaxID=106591 RepID=UPI0007152F41|nr:MULTISPECIES: ABC transporter permease [Ensifer]KQZ42722.1 peptide ABC transporter permease [Ensifer sp. Root558]MBD9496381.1 ABC transporter permease [Ensifer sp. ENS01]MBD9560216.1 ABC transporter permease [Ensifer sp. ENS03]MBD9595922.1 ABC transporter permease [Ensifer sp. ENS05]MBD9626439.1 ABC transporter permease [Ensifer sp. ENS06]
MVDATMQLAHLAPPQSYSRRVVRRFLKHRLAVASLAFLLLMTIVIVIGPFLSPYSFDGQDFTLIGSPGPMTAEHWLGTDELGRDVMTRLIYGGRVSLAVGLAGAIIATIAGTLVGALSGFYRGLSDMLLMRFTDVMLSIPTLPLVLLLSGLFRPNPPLLVAIVGMLIWMGTARLVRSQFLALREREFVEAARALGAGGARLMFRHILPNAIGPITVAATLAVGSAIMLESALSFLGFGIQPPVPTWGNLLNSASPWLSVAPWLAIPPGLLILCTVLAVNFLGDGLRDAMEPKE